MGPPGQGLDPAHPSGRYVHLRLEGHADRATGQGLAQRGHDGELALPLDLVGGLPQDRAAVGVASAVHRRLGAPDQGGRLGPVLRGADATDRQPYVRADGADLRAALDLGPQPQPEHLRLAGEGGGRGDGEPAAADPAHDGVGQSPVQAGSDLQEQLVTDLVPEGVVDLAERVDGEGREHDAARVPLEQCCQPAGGLAEVRQPGERVRRRGPLEVGDQPSALQGCGELCPHGLQQPQVAHVEATDRPEPVLGGQDAHQPVRADERGGHALGGP